MMRWCSIILLSLVNPLVAAEEPSLSRTQAAQIAQQKFGGKVISVDEIELPSADGEDDPTVQSGARFVVKLMHSGRVQVVNLDAQGQPLPPAP
jgi:uncharacterized membrane protein YkoI